MATPGSRCRPSASTARSAVVHALAGGGSVADVVAAITAREDRTMTVRFALTWTCRAALVVLLALGALATAASAQDARLEAAKKEGKVVWYTSLALPSAEKVAKLFEAAYPGHQGRGAPHGLAADPASGSCRS